MALGVGIRLGGNAYIHNHAPPISLRKDPYGRGR